MAQQLNIFGEAEDERATGPHPPLFSVSQQIIDEVLTSGGNEINSVLRIAAYFKKDHMTAANADFLKQEYGSGGKGFIFGGNHVSVWFDDSGIRIAAGDTVLTDAASRVTWEQAARRIRELLDMGRYMPQSELDKVDGYEIKTLADSLWYLQRDIEDKANFDFMDEELFKHGFPDDTARIAELLAQPEEREKILVGLQDFAAAYGQDNSLLRFPYAVRHLRAALTGLEDLQLEPLVFTADESVSSARPGFITQDEIDRVLAGGGQVENGKYRIYSYFLQEHTAKEKADFLKHEYGTGGHSRTGFDEWHDSKGIAYSRENNHMPYDKVILSWSKVARRIDELIADGRYMSEAQLAHLPEYEKDFLAGEIYSFFPRQPEDLARPFPYSTEYSEGKKVVRPQLDQPERVAEILTQMAAILDNTADFDRNYKSMRKAFDNLTAYQNGTFSLFTPANKPTEQAQARPAKSKQPPAPEPSAVPDAEYDFQLGATVYIGTDEYEIYSFDDAHVVLRDATAPLFTRDIPRAEFDRKLRENRLNDGLIKVTAAPASTVTEETPRVLYKRYLPKLVDEILQDELYSFLQDEETQAYEAEIEIGNWLDYAAESGEYPGLQEALELPDFRDWLREDILDRTYQDVAADGRDSVTKNEMTGSAPEWAQPENESLTEEPAPEPQQTVQPTEPETTASNQHTEEISGLKSIVIELGAGAREAEPVINAADATLTPAWDKPKPRSLTQTFDPHPDIPQSERHNFVITDDDLGHGGAKTKYRGNVDAIKTLQAIEAENYQTGSVRFATPEEQEILSRYVGWGSLADAFDEKKPAWTNEYLELKSLLSPEEYDSARASTLNAHYTSPTVIKAIYKAVENMGFKTGNVLEPSCGIGNFFGLVPESMSGSKLFGVELDGLTGRIARQLYQKNSIAIQGFEKTELPDSFFDLAVGNVPFGGFGVLDKRYDKHKFHIHDYFFAKTLDKVRPGGVIAFVTSRYTMDKKNPTVRKYIAQRADLLGAIRLPCNAFMANAGTEVTADIIFLQKRDRIIDIEPDWVHLGEIENDPSRAGSIPVNSYFAEHPDMILGTMSNDSGLRMYGAENSYSCVPFPDSDLSEQLADAITNIHAEITEYERGED